MSLRDMAEEALRRDLYRADPNDPRGWERDKLEREVLRLRELVPGGVGGILVSLAGHEPTLLRVRWGWKPVCACGWEGTRARRYDARLAHRAHLREVEAATLT